jgi:hypothetical protein
VTALPKGKDAPQRVLITAGKSDPFGTFGNEQLCMWRVAPSICWFQTRRPHLARKLSQRSRAGLVAYSVHGGYLRVFQEKISPRSARKLVTRYLRIKDITTLSIKATNARFLGQNVTASTSKPAGRVKIAERVP